MDPNAALEMIIEAATSGDHYALREASNNLIEWLASGGFAPGDPTLGA